MPPRRRKGQEDSDDEILPKGKVSEPTNESNGKGKSGGKGPAASNPVVANPAQQGNPSAKKKDKKNQGKDKWKNDDNDDYALDPLAHLKKLTSNEPEPVPPVKQTTSKPAAKAKTPLPPPPPESESDDEPVSSHVGKTKSFAAGFADSDSDSESEEEVKEKKSKKDKKSKKSQKDDSESEEEVKEKKSKKDKKSKKSQKDDSDSESEEEVKEKKSKKDKKSKKSQKGDSDSESEEEVKEKKSKKDKKSKKSRKEDSDSESEEEVKEKKSKKDRKSKKSRKDDSDSESEEEVKEKKSKKDKKSKKSQKDDSDSESENEEEQEQEVKEKKSKKDEASVKDSSKSQSADVKTPANDAKNDQRADQKSASETLDNSTQASIADTKGMTTPEETKVVDTAVEKKDKPKLSSLQARLQKAKIEKDNQPAPVVVEVSKIKIDTPAPVVAVAPPVAPVIEEKPSIPTQKAEVVVPKKVVIEEPSDAVEDDDKDLDPHVYSTMYGDDVVQDANALSTVESTSGDGSSKKKDRLSNKERRRLAREAEDREREEEYQRALMKASIEGAQFAVSQSIVDPNDPQWQNMLDITIPSVSISAHSKELLVNSEFCIAHGRRYGLVGPNGAGKSTLLKMIAYGELKIPPRIDYLYVEQEVLADHTPAVDAVLKADKERWELVQEEKQILADNDKFGNCEARDVRLGEIHEQMAQINASAAESKARRILFGLGFDAEMQARPTKYFSGGWRMRISLARALFIEPTLLMLDEPTNHLDLNAVIWLDDYLQKWKKTLLIVSHDQDFLNSVCQEIVHLEDKKLVVYKGNYDSFKEQEATKRQQLQKAWEKQEKKIREMKMKGLSKESAEKSQLKSRSREPGARSKKSDKGSASIAESAENQVELIKRPKDYSVQFIFNNVALINPPIIQVRDVEFQYLPQTPVLFKGVNFGIDMESRICIVGPNGSGKSTMLKLITGDLNPSGGEILRNPRLRVGIYNQHFVDRLPMDKDPVSYLRGLFSDTDYQTTRNLLGKFGLEGHAHEITIRDLSGGQKARVVFAELSLMNPHLLFLDEPTNNLDIESIDALCDALRSYNGGVILVSHDARLIETTNCQLWVVDNQNVTPWKDGGFAGYREHLLEELEKQLSLIVPGSGERPKS